MFEKVQQAIELGDLKKALKTLRSVGKLEELLPRDLLMYFQLCRRLGDFQTGALQLEKLGALIPELEIEKAFFLGELGATKQAVRLLQFTRGSFSDDFEIQRYLQLGNFLSVMHKYDEAITSYSQMESFAKNTKPVLALVARLNILGHKIYAGKDIQETYLELIEFTEKQLQPYPLIQQGGFYFLSLASSRMNENTRAQKFLDKAISLGVQHRMRESLLLELTAFELTPTKLQKAQIAALKKKIFNQVHIIYLDQFHKIQGMLCEQQGEVEAASRYYLKVLFGQRDNNHYIYCLDRYRRITGDESILGWQFEASQPKALSSNQIIYNQLERRQWPLITKGRADILLKDEGQLMSNLLLQLSKNLGFAMRDAEVWELLWRTPFNFISSPTAIRTALTRFRKSALSESGEIFQKDRRLSYKMKAGWKFFISPDYLSISDE